MTVPDKLPGGKNSQAVPALARLLSDSALSRAALAACGFPVALADAGAKGRPLTYVNSAFEAFFGYRGEEVQGRPVITLLFPEDEGAASMFNDGPVRQQMRARRKDGAALGEDPVTGPVPPRSSEAPVRDPPPTAIAHRDPWRGSS